MAFLQSPNKEPGRPLSVLILVVKASEKVALNPGMPQICQGISLYVRFRV